jgi:predicted AlkP superfamily phosphohydrolase/phosphomutase
LTEAFCRHLGYQIPVESALRPLRLLDFARRVIPAAWRIALSRRLPRKTRERLLVDQFRNGTDWRKTTAFALPSFYTGFLRVNLRGREPQGVVEPGAGYEALLDRLEADLRQLIDPVTNQPAVRQVARTVELFGGGSPVSLPDLFFEWTPTSYLKRRVIHPRAVLTQENLDFSRGTHHTHHGFVAAAGPSIQQGALGAIQVLDLSPTFLFLLGEPVPQRMTGQVIKALVHG